MSKQIFKNYQGFSLIEIMVALAILSTVFLGLTLAFPYALQISKSGEMATQAAFLAQEKIEEILQLDYSDIIPGTIESRHHLSAVTTSSLYAYERETSAALIDQNFNTSVTDEGIKSLTTTVYYHDNLSDIERIYKISTIIINK